MKPTYTIRDIANRLALQLDYTPRSIKASMDMLSEDFEENESYGSFRLKEAWDRGN